MTIEKFKRRTIRLSPIIDKELEIIAKKNHITVNKLVSELITYNINDLDKVYNTITISNILELLWINLLLCLFTFIKFENIIKLNKIKTKKNNFVYS